MVFDVSELRSVNGFSGGRNNRNNGNQQQNKKKNKGKNRDNRQQSSTPSAILNSGMDYERGSDDRSFNTEDSKSNDNDNNTMSQEVAEAADTLNAFLEDYADMCKQSGNQVADVIRDSFWDVTKIMTHYYDPKYSGITGEINKVLDIMASQRFAIALTNLLNTENIEGWHDGVNDIWKSVMFAISTALITCHKRMKDETVEAYIDLLSSPGISGKDIDRLSKELGITKDLAVDLVASIPVIPEDMTDITLKQFYSSFVMKLMEHADENIDVLDRGTQGKLFSFFFGKEHIALKAIGRMLAAVKITGFENEAQKIVYAEYLSMLSDRLDAYDIKDIKFVLKFIVNEKKRLGKDTMMLFGYVSIVEYGSIRKAELELISSDSDAKEYLVMN